jgi:hypothetical protein
VSVAAHNGAVHHPKRDECNARFCDGVARGRGRLRRQFHGHERVEQRRLIRRHVLVFLEHVGVVVGIDVFVRIDVRILLGLVLRLLVGLVLRFFFGDIVGLLVWKLDELRELRG